MCIIHILLSNLESLLNVHDVLAGIYSQSLENINTGMHVFEFKSKI